MGATYKYDRYVAEANADPFLLELDDGEVIEVPASDGDTVLEIEVARGSWHSLELLCCEH